MALQVWLPLNGDLHNQGLQKIVFNNNGATINNSGKIGSCYSFNGSSNYLYSTYNFYNNKYSVSAWIYSTSSSATQTICCDRTATGCGFSIFLISGKLRIDAGGNNLQWTTNYTYPINTWFHLTVTYNGTNVSYYINGEYKETKAQTLTASYWGTITSIGASQTNGSNYANYLNGRLNDIRIYNHTLSDKEIKKLSEGLTLHYKLNDLAMEATTNLFYPTLDTSCQTLTGFSANQNVTLSLDTINSIPAIKATSNQNTSTPGIKLGTFAVTENTDYTLSCILESNCVSCLSAYQIKSSPQTIKTKGEKVIINFNSGSSTSIIFYAFMIVPETNQYIKIAQPQLEQKNHVTAYTINNRNNNNIYDSSGYRNNALANGSSQITNNNSSIKYNNCANFISGCRIATPVASSTFMPRDMITVNIWIKTTASANRFLSCTETGGFNFESASGAVSFPLYITGKGYTRVNGGTPWASLNDNNWHMITATYDRERTKLYIDGVIDTIETSSYPNIDIGYNASTPFTLGAEAQTIASPLAGTYVGQLSDCRIYATALSAEDILKLYKDSKILNGTNRVPRDLS